jgi:DNA-binding FadR family transcriptional regulator
MDIKPIKSKRTTEIILDQIKQFMVEGQLKPGDKLPTEMELVDRFQVSRTSVREALSALNLTGILEIRQGEGIFVRRPPENAIIQPLSYILLMEKDRLQNVLEVRKALEVEAAQLAAIRRNEDDIFLMRKLMNDMKRDLPEAKNSDKIDLAFHLAIAQASKNQLMARLMNTFQDIIGQAFHFTRALWMSSVSGSTQRLYDEHKKISVAIIEGNSERARILMHDHLNRVEEELRRIENEE